ncbi:predicted protein [Naegleria gruberi]|uniref:Predicted protein n=1 Tax=Naegleria gruberi TaxID=5762 RepID=D2VU75_NAEGR|nr:uncharacterized protein NAEGRDRAFT_72562 [Naegleria gruberi]EFC39582.1 predicted protein [Naegleria gruberi]|eukprot:XP_002672326.1 predicted protein [Naegleria gruberi strain NEG-M]
MPLFKSICGAGDAVDDLKMVREPPLLIRELLIHIGKFMLVRDLFHFSCCNSYLLELFFDPKDYKKLSKEKRRLIKKNQLNYKSELLIQEYSKEERNDFSQIQLEIWKRLVCFYFPSFDSNLNVKNWLHVMRRRVEHITLYKPSALPLNPEVSCTVDFSVFNKFLEQGHLDNYMLNDSTFVANCEWIYKCPLNFSQLMYSDSFFCKECNKKVYRVSSVEELKEKSALGQCIAFGVEEQFYGGLM